MSNESRHLRIYRLDESMLRTLFLEGGTYQTLVGAPPDAIYHGCRDNWPSRSIDVMFEHPSFPLVPMGAEAPRERLVLEIVEHPKHDIDAFVRYLGGEREVVYVYHGADAQRIMQTFAAEPVIPRLVAAVQAWRAAISPIRPDGVHAAEQALLAELAAYEQLVHP